LDIEGKIVDVSIAGAAAETGGTFRGIAASPGAASGTARRVTGPDEAGKIMEGDIAVVDACSPWMSMLFHRAAGVIATTGGAVSHLALAAREFGRPMLVSVQGLRGIEVDGRRIEIDTAAGTARFMGED
jgi:phosphoenolpyruvate synthase/pyruvate phosphate dikinase